MNIVLCYPAVDRDVERIEAAWPEANVINAGQEGVAEALFEADIFCGHAKVPVDWDGVVRQGRLKWIQSSAAGMDHCLVPSVIASDIDVTSASGLLADQVAEHSLALITGWTRSLPVFFHAVEKREFIRRPTRDLMRATVGIVGCGGNGRRLAQVLRPWKTRIITTDLYPMDQPDYIDELWPADQLDRLLEESDIVVLLVPLNDDTRYLIDAEKLAKMKEDAILVNMARGPIVKTEDMVAWLNSHPKAAAVMDVTDPEPLPPEHALWECKNAIITPHVGGQSSSRIDDVTRIFCENIRRRRAGEPLLNFLTDKRLGFPIRGESPLWVDVETEID